MTHPPDLLFEARGVSKQYPGTRALDDVTLRLAGGQVMALIGENGAGKSTLVKILGGIEQPSAGALWLDSREVCLRSVRDADALGIGMIHQELNLCPNLSVAENIFLGRELTSHGVSDLRRQEAEARALMVRLGQSIDVARFVGDLPLGQQQIVEIAKALAREVRVLMMDEPTSALSATEIEVLFRIMADLKARGVAIVYISHRLEELLTVAERVAVLRDGRLVAEAAASDVDTGWIVEKMTGRAAREASVRARVADAAELLRADSISLLAANGRAVLRDVSFTLAKGEILGIYGLMGAGRTELLECLLGLRPEAGGTVWLGTRKLSEGDVASRMAAGLAMVPEDRQAAGLVASLSVMQNMTLASLGQYVKGFWLSHKAETDSALSMVRELRIRIPGLNHNIGSLSGGNQQKVILARCLLNRPEVLLLDEPTRGVDVGAKQEIYAIVRRLAAEGLGVVFVSSELDEVRALADRILVLSRGSVTGEFDADGTTGDELAKAASAQPGAGGGWHARPN